MGDLKMFQDFLLSKGLRDISGFGVISNHGLAFDYFRYVLNRRGLRVVRVKDYNVGRHRLIECEDEYYNRFLFYCLFKKDFFHSFNYEFKEFTDKYEVFKGFGESINCEFLHVAVTKKAVLVFIYEDGKVYFTYPDLIKNFCEKYNLIRVQDRNNKYKKHDYSGTIQLVQEKTYSFPIMLLKKFKEWELC